MYYPTTMQTVDPKLAVRGATDMLIAHPSLLVWRVLADVVIQVGRVAFVVLMAGLVVVVVVSKLRAGQGLGQVLHSFGNPLFLLGLAGASVSATLIGYMLDTLVWSGIWSSAGRLLRGERRLVFWGDAAAQFARALWLRITVLLHDLAIVAMFGSLVIGAIVLTSWAEMGLWASALTWGATMLFYVCAAVLIRLTASVTAAGMFTEGRSWADAWLEAATVVVRQPIVFYRVFVLSAAMLFPPLLFYYFVLFVFNVTVGTPAAAMGELFRLLGEFVMLVGFAVFFVVTQLGFFNAYSLARGQEGFVRPASRRKEMARQTPPSLTDLLPRQTPNLVNVDELLTQVPASEASTADAAPTEDNNRPSQDTPEENEQPFDLDSVLKGTLPDASDGKDPE